MCEYSAYIGPRKLCPSSSRPAQTRVTAATIPQASRRVAVGKLEIRRRPGKLRNLEEVIAKSPLKHYGIGHTRWATHGALRRERPSSS